MAIFTVTAGHGEGQPGAIRGKFIEANLMADLRDRVADRLLAKGHSVRTDGTGALNRALTYALTLVPGSGIAVDLHLNAAGDPLARGVEVVSRPGHKRRAQIIAQAIAGVLDTRIRGDNGWQPEQATPHKRLAYLAAGGMVVEVCFISNPWELDKFLGRRDEVAQAIADSLEAGLSL